LPCINTLLLFSKYVINYALLLNIKVFLKYSYQNGKELPEKRDDVDTKVTLVGFSYNF
jgi:hypothetical protein